MDIISSFVSFIVYYYQVFLIAPIILAFKAESHYVGRAAIVANSVSMFVAVAPYWNYTYSWVNINGFPFFQLYVVVGLFFGFIAFISYIFQESVDTSFYKVSFVLYNSVVAGIVCLVAAIYL